MRGYLHFSFEIPISLAKICFFSIVITFVFGITVLKRAVTVQIERLHAIRDLRSACISVDLLRIQLQMREDVHSLHQGNFKVWASGLCSLYQGFCYPRVHYIGVLFHPFNCNFDWTEEQRSLHRGFRYTGVRYIGVPLHYQPKRTLSEISNFYEI